jgi:hypothetical protein
VGAAEDLLGRWVALAARLRDTASR